MEHNHYSLRICWTPDMLSLLKRKFATTLNDDLVGMLGVSLRTMLRKARELGLEKDPDWLKAVWDERRFWANCASRAKGHPGCFKKGHIPHNKRITP